MNENPMIYKAICSAMGKITAVKKTLENESEGFKYRGIDDVMNQVHGIFAETHIFVVPEVLAEKRSYGKTLDGCTVFYSRQRIRFTFYAEDGSSVQCVVIGEAQDCSDKASNKALSSGLKYALLQVFCIPTEDDKDSDRTSVKTKAGSVKKEAAKEPEQPKEPAELAGGESTDAEKQEIQELLKAKDGKGKPLFSKKEKESILKSREHLTAAELIKWIKDETERKLGCGAAVPEKETPKDVY